MTQHIVSLISAQRGQNTAGIALRRTWFGLFT